MQRAMQKFTLNLQSVKDLGQIYVLVSTNFPLIEENADDILRAKIVLMVSAFDTFIHDVVKIGMGEIFAGTRLPNTKYNDFKLSLSTLSNINNSVSQSEKIIYFESEIEKINSKDSFQSPKSIDYALGLINISSVWTLISSLMNNVNAKDIRDRLGLIVDRRNKIAHESDHNPVTRDKYPIQKRDVDNDILFIENLCKAIYTLV
jgi:hypothetical protein